MAPLLRTITFLLLQVITLSIFAQKLVYQKDYPVNNVKNLFMVRNDNGITLMHSYNNGKISFELLDSSFSKIKSGTEVFEFTTWEYITTFTSNDAFSILYKDGKNLALAIVSINGPVTYRFIKIGAFINNDKESLFGFKEAKDKGYFFVINRKASTFNVITVSQKGIISRNIYNAPIKLTKNFDNTAFDLNNKVTNPITFNSVDNDKPQHITLTKERSKSFFVNNKLYFCFRGASEKDDSACIKIVTFDLSNNSFQYKEIPNTLISLAHTGVDNINYTILDNKIYCVHLTQSDFKVVALDATDYSELYRYSTSDYNEHKFPVKKLSIDGEDNLTGNAYLNTDTIIPDKYEFLFTVLNKKRKTSTTEYTVAIAANKQADNIILSIGSARTTYFRAEIQGYVDMFNVPMGSVYTLTNNNYRNLLLPYFPKNKGENFQSTQFYLKLDTANNIAESGKADNINDAIRNGIINILKNGIKIKDIQLYIHNNDVFFSIINSKDNMIELYKLDTAKN
jgi:hypothetical protein